MTTTPPNKPSVKPPITEAALIVEAKVFAELESTFDNQLLFGITDGKAVGTYIEQKFRESLSTKYEVGGSAALGLDIPSLNIDIKVTNVRQPQSSCPFRNARQKVYGLGYSLLLFVYEKVDNRDTAVSRLTFLSVVLISSERTGDYQLTRTLLEILDNGGNAEDIAALLLDRNLPLDEIGAANLAAEIVAQRPELGYLTISNALQWRLNYGHAIRGAGHVSGLNVISSRGSEE